MYASPRIALAIGNLLAVVLLSFINIRQGESENISQTEHLLNKDFPSPIHYGHFRIFANASRRISRFSIVKFLKSQLATICAM